MKIDVYDSYAKNEQGCVMYFDVFVKSDVPAEEALKYGQDWLESVGENAVSLDQSRCNFCHSEVANPEVARSIENQGYFILQMEGCPAPY